MLLFVLFCDLWKISFSLVAFVSICRKQDLRELKLLQKNENKQYQDLIYKAQIAREMQDRKFESDMQVSEGLALLGLCYCLFF